VKASHWIGVLVISLSLLNCAPAERVPINVQYQPAKQFLDLQRKIGSTLAVAPVKDERVTPIKDEFVDRIYLGTYAPLAGNIEYYKSEAFPLYEAIMESLSRVLPPYGVKLVRAPPWDGNPESLKETEADSLMTVEIRKFWAESKREVWGSKVNISIQFLIYLGVKKENKVFTRYYQVDRSDTTPRVTREWMEGTINQILAQIFDSLFSNPY
jgi:hypothetical protein